MRCSDQGDHNVNTLAASISNGATVCKHASNLDRAASAVASFQFPDARNRQTANIRRWQRIASWTPESVVAHRRVFSAQRYRSPNRSA
jgi:hypothetical protein